MKPGDKVKLIKTGKVGWESDDWATAQGLKLGVIYTVAKVNSFVLGVEIEFNGMTFVHHMSKFKLVKELKAYHPEWL